MKKTTLVDDYLRDYAADIKWKLTASNTNNISMIVVIPAYAEKETLFSTLMSLAQNPVSSLDESLILCVINNKKTSPSDDIRNNRQTIGIIDALIKKKSINNNSISPETQLLIKCLADARINLGYIDASSTGYEIPENAGGVGMARKIGMDMALRLSKEKAPARNLILSLDADTLVRENYLPAVKNYFTKRINTAVISYEHQTPARAEEAAAICCYEIFLRYWVLGLGYAKSPWAFHSIGSTIVTTTDAYLAVRGMNKRDAGEDFYFLNKLAKISRIHYLKETCVYPSARPSTRVVFGTGKRIQRFLSGIQQEYLLYDPKIFQVLADWLEYMRSAIDCTENEIMTAASKIHPYLSNYLADAGFAQAWMKIRKNATDTDALLRQFNFWFDGFRTLKFVNYFTRNVYPQINMFTALGKLLFAYGDKGFNLSADIPQLEEQWRILQYLRNLT